MKKHIDEELPMCQGHEHGANDAELESAKEALPSEDLLYELSDFFRIFADPTRLKILFTIEEPMCVCDIARVLGMTKSAVSHQLKILRQSDLVRYRKSGKNVFYSLSDEHVKVIIEYALEHIKE